ncbi:MAG: ATP-binding protein, partial [Candidatus Hodarchaeales archaeon]
LLPCRFPISSQAQIDHPPKGLVSKIISYRGDQGIYLGDIVTYKDHTDPFLISPKFIERHVLCVASTGAGKSYSVGVLLEEIIMKFKSATVLLFDMHNEYWGLAQPNDGVEIEQLDYEEYSPREFQDNILVFEKDALGLGTQFDLPRIRRLIDLTAAQENSLSNLIKKPILLDELVSLIQKSDFHTSTRETLISKIKSLQNMNLFEKELELNTLICPGQISIIRLDQFTDEKKRNLFVNEVLTLVFEKKIHEEIAKEQEVVLVVEEAHRFSTTNKILSRIAREGRKFGIYEILISQRPADFPDDIIANMNTLIALRIRSDKDINKIRLMEGISTEVVSNLPHLIRGEALIVGLGSQGPIKIHVRPRLSKHIDPQEDEMPSTIPRYRGIMKIEGSKVVSDPSMDELDTPMSEPAMIEQDESTPATEIEAFSYKDLTNLLTCKHILILHKNTGLCIFEQGITMLKIDPQLVSGFLSAISGLFSELKTDLVKERSILRIFTEEIGDKAFEILTVEGANSVTAVILDRTPKYLNDFKRRIRNFSYQFEIEFGTNLKEFVGLIDEFAPAIKVLDRYLGLSLISPLQLNRSYREEISHPILYEVINRQVDQLALSEGLFAIEIVNQCLLDSDYSYRKITEVIISYLHDGILVLADQNRTLPHFVSPIHPVELQLEEIESEDQASIHSEADVSEFISGEGSQEVGEEDIKWFTELVGDLQENSLPTTLMSDILERDLIFESDIGLDANSIRILTYSKSELLQWAALMTQKGFVLDNKAINPLNGVKISLKTDFTTIISSIAQLESGDYIFLIGEAK